MRHLLNILVFFFSTTSFCTLPPQKIRIIYTNDWQSNLDLAPMALAKIKELQTQSPYPTLTVDAGDTLMGSLYHTIAHKTGGGFTLMGKAGFDVTTLGNHEFDFGLPKLSQILRATHRTHPSILASNLILDTRVLQKDPQLNVFKKSLLIEKNGLKIGVIGLMGQGAQGHIKASENFHFTDPIKTAHTLVSQLKKQGAVYILALSHGGIHLKEGNSWSGDDINLSETPGLDLIVGGHSHTVLHAPLYRNKTWITQAGSHLRYVGHIDINIEENTVIKAKLHRVSQELSGEFAMTVAQELSHWRDHANKTLQEAHGLSWRDPIPMKKETNPKETQNLVAEAIRSFAQSDFSMIGAGEIYPQDTQKPWTVDTTFKVLPLGHGVNTDTPGSAILKTWFYGYEILNLIETMEVLSEFIDSDFEPIFSGAHISINTYRPPFFKIYRFNLMKNQQHLDPYELYSVATTSFGGSYLWKIQDLSYGLLSMTPKNSQGQKSQNFKLHTLRSSDASEAKAWTSIALWLKNHTQAQQWSLSIIRAPDILDAFYFYATVIIFLFATLYFLRFILMKLKFLLKTKSFLPNSRLSLKTKEYDRL